MAQPRMPTFGQANFANQLFGQAGSMRRQALITTNQAFAVKDAKMQRAMVAMEKFGAALHAREQEKAAKKKSGAGLGSGIGMAVGIGLSLLVPGGTFALGALMAGVGTAAGGTIGAAIAPGGSNAQGMTAQGAQAIGASLSNIYNTFENSSYYSASGLGGGPTVQSYDPAKDYPHYKGATAASPPAPQAGERFPGVAGTFPDTKSTGAFKAQGVLGTQAADRLGQMGEGVPQPSFQPAAGDIGPPGPGWIKTPDGWVNLFQSGRN